MAEYPDDAPNPRRRSPSLPPFVAPRAPGGTRGARHHDAAPPSSLRTPTRLFTPPRAVVHSVEPDVAPCAQDGGVGAMSDAVDVAAAEANVDLVGPCDAVLSEEPLVPAWNTPRADEADADDAADAIEPASVTRIWSNEVDAGCDEGPEAEDGSEYPAAVCGGADPTIGCGENPTAASRADEESTPDDDDDDWFAEERSSAHEVVAADDDDWFSEPDDEMAPPLLASPSAALEPAPFYGLDDLERLSGATTTRETPSRFDAAAAVDAGGALPWDGSHPERHHDTDEHDGTPVSNPTPESSVESVHGVPASPQTEVGAWPEPDDSRATVAEALERVALRIRNGHVSLPSDLPSPSEEAALAAVLAALLQSRAR